jgi:hypothetical protein
MTTDRDVDRITAQFLRDGPAELADRVLDDALDEIHLTRQRRRLAAPWRNRPMSSFSLRLAAVIAVIAVGGFALFQLGRGPTIAGPATPLPATPLPTVPPSLAAVASAGPTATATPVAPTPGASTGLLAPLGYAGSGTIAFTRDDPAGGGSVPFLVDPSGANETRIVIERGWGSAASVPGTGCCGVFSPDGSKLAVGYDEVNPPRGGTLAATQVFSLDGSSLSLIPMVCGACAMIDGVDFVPRAWSAGEHGLLALDVASSADPTRAGITLAPMDGLPSSVGWQTQVTGQPDDRPLAFSPDGKSLLFVRRTTDTGGELWVMTLATKKVQRLSQVGQVVSADDYLSPGATWSPDGKQVTYAATDASGSTGNMRVFVVDAAGGLATAITPASRYSTTAAWSPDGTWIGYDVDMGTGFHHVFVVHPDGSGARDLMPDALFGACCAHWSPDGSALVAPATTGDDDQSQLLVLPLDGSGIRQVTTIPGYYTSISWGAASR